MWDKHWCPQASERVTEMAPYIDNVAKIARDLGVLIIHAPSGVTEFYANHPARINATRVPRSKNLPEEIGNWCTWINSDEEKVYPIDQSDGGCECADCLEEEVWSRQIEIIDIQHNDMISDSGEEIWSIMEWRGIENVILVGVHVNMCVLVMIAGDGCR